MKKSLLLLAALACTGAIAQEKQVWACQQTDSTMLEWENGSWNSYRVAPVPLLLTIDGLNSRVKEGDKESEYACSILVPIDKISCLDITQSSHIYLDRITGKMGTSLLYGATLTGDRRDTVSAHLYNCTKF